MFRRLLVANRGEIAARVLRACREMGIESVVVHSTADAGAPWLALADRSVCIGPAAASRSYLDIDAVLQAAAQTDCQAVHPGYGFLSENALFAARCAAQHLAFIGPTARVMRLMGDKIEARRTMRAEGLPVIPGSDGAVADAAEAARIASEVGYPVFLKAAAGGGGKGMRRCADEASLARAFQEASLEAQKAFGNPALYLEKAIEGGRHIEIQLLADGWGHAIHLNERECSVQRQHQKLIEESPSPAMTPALRADLGGRVAAALARLGYRGAGTVEFLRDASGSFYFMEMNTRLQVEHPVTEAITGVDLVAWQIRVAANERLSLDQRAIGVRGHAIECRVNAEDPDAGFRPCPGAITRFEPPPGARVDTFVPSGAARDEAAPLCRVPPHYDSLIAKMIVHGADRAAAVADAAAAVAAFRIEGVKTTLPFHARALAHPAFRAGAYDLTLVDSMLPAPEAAPRG